MQTPTRFNGITADVKENVLRFKEGYFNKSHYQYAEAVFTSQGKKRVNDKEETDRQGERERCKMVWYRDEKQRGGAGCG